MGFKSGLNRVLFASRPKELRSGAGRVRRGLAMRGKRGENPIPAKIGKACCGALHAPRAVYNSIMRLA